MKILTYPILITALIMSSARAAAQEYTLPDGIKVSALEEPFEPSKHEITYCEGIPPCPCEVDGQWPIGTAPCRLPADQLKRLVVTIAGKAYELDTSGMYNAFEGHRHEGINGYKLFTVKCQTGDCTVRGAFSDGAGSYVAEWKIENGKSRRTLLSADEAIMFRFIKAMQKP